MERGEKEEVDMVHEHEVINVDKVFVIDPLTRKVSSGEKKKLVQRDHNSKRYAFEMPKEIGGHDMTLCTKVEIHYVNISKDKRMRREDVYPVNDFNISAGDENKLAFTWLVSRNATQLEGIVAFLIKYVCLNGEEEVYAWHTDICADEIFVGEGQDNSEAVVETYSDVLEAWKKEVLDGASFSGSAKDVTFDNEGTELKAENVQEALTEISEQIDDITVGNFIDYDLNVKAVNHRGYSTEAPENTIPAYILSKKKGFKYVEADVSFTKDGVAVLLHDSTVDRTSNGFGNINNLTYSEVLMYDFGSWKNSKYIGTKIPTFEEFIMTCKAIGLHPYIELKSSEGYTQEQITSIVNMVEICGMKGKVTYISFNATFLDYVKTADSKARLGYLADITTSTIATASDLKTEENEVFMDADYRSLTAEKVQMCIANELPLEIWTVNSQSVIENMNNYVSGVTSDNLIAGKILYNKYMTYTEPDSPDVPATGITLNKTILTFNEATAQTLVATVEPTYSTDTVVWTSNNEAVAKVSNGIVTPIKKGSCTITATAGSVSATCEVTVNVEEIVTYTITRNLTNCTSSSTVTSINKGSAYTETIAADTGYTLDGATVSITMGGIDISSSIVDGVLNIPSVTGNIVITVTALKIEINGSYVWDFTKSLTDTTGTHTIVTTGNNVTRNENGLAITGAYAPIYVGEFGNANTEIELDVSAMDGKMTTTHGRLIVFSTDSSADTGDQNSGLLYRGTGTYKGWSFYCNAWDSQAFESDMNYFANKTVRLVIDENRYLNVYEGDVLLKKSDNPLPSNYTHLYIGSKVTTFYNETLTGLRVKEI